LKQQQQQQHLRAKNELVTPHWATLNRTTVKRRQFIRRQLTGATVNRSDK